MIDEKKLIEERPRWLNPDCAGNEEYNKGWNACNKYWCNTIKRQPKFGEWIPCSERLPPEPNTNNTFDKNPVYLVSVNGEDYPYRALWNGRNFMNGFLILEAVAWMTLPEPYQPEGLKKRSNADIIRAMSDEDLALNMMCPNENGLAEIDCDKSDNCNCYECLLKWLQSEVE